MLRNPEPGQTVWALLPNGTIVEDKVVGPSKGFTGQEIDGMVKLSCGGNVPEAMLHGSAEEAARALRED